MEAVQQAANQFARSGYDKAAIIEALAQQFPDVSELTREFAAVGCFQQVPPEPPPAAPEPPATTSARAKLPSRNKYNWNSMPTALLPVEARQSRTLVPSTIASMPSVFNGEPNTVHTFQWGSVRVEGQLFDFDLRVVIALTQEVQANECRCANGSLAAETSGQKLYQHINPGKYGGSGLCRIKRALERLRRTVIHVEDTRNGEQYRFRIIDSYETIAAVSGRRLVVRLGHTLTDRVYAKGGIQGMKPLDLEPWRDLRGRATIAYMMFDTITSSHSTTEMNLENCFERFGLKGSLPRRTHRLKQLVATLHGRSCVPREPEHRAHLEGALLPGKVRVRRVEVPVG